MKEVRTFTTRNGFSVTLRPAAPEDADAIIKTVRSTSLERSYIMMEQYSKDPEWERQFITGMDLTRNFLLVAVADGKVIGSLAALQADNGLRPQTAHVLNIGLHLSEEFRGFGIGSEMLHYAIDWAKEHGFKKISASIFTPSKRSLNLFKRAGFSEECVRLKQIRIGRDYIDEICMGKLLD